MLPPALALLILIGSCGGEQAPDGAAAPEVAHEASGPGAARGAPADGRAAGGTSSSTDAEIEELVARFGRWQSLPDYRRSKLRLTELCRQHAPLLLEKVRPYVERAATDPSAAAVLDNACDILADAGVASAAPVIVGWVDLPSDTLRRKVVKTLGAFGDPVAVPRLTELAVDEDEPVGTRIDALVALSRIGDGSRAARLHPLTGDGVPMELRLQAIKTLGQLRDGTVADELAALLTEDHPERVRKEAAVALLRLEDQRGFTLIDAWMASPEPDRRREAVLLLGPSPIDGAIPRLVTLADDPDGAVQLAAIGALSTLTQGGDLTADRLTRLRQHADPSIRRAARLLAAQLGDASALAELRRHAADPAAEDRIPAMVGLGRLRDTASVALFREIAANQQETAETRLVAIRNLTRIRREDSIGPALDVALAARGTLPGGEPLGAAMRLGVANFGNALLPEAEERFTGTRDPEMQIRIAEILGHIRSRESHDALVRLRKHALDGSVAVRLDAALETLAQLGVQ